ncbi:MAG: FitA-like ribbon-helix-helix domain-containing protein [Acidimicrobiales bacterium]
MATLQIRNFPDDLKERVRERADRADLTMSDYVIRLVRTDLEQPTMEEWLARAAQLPRHDHLSETPAQALAAARSEAGLE